MTKGAQDDLFALLLTTVDATRYVRDPSVGQQSADPPPGERNAPVEK
jgi:hypothetical protein